MSRENVTAFLEKVRTDAALAARVQSLHREVGAETARALASLAAEAGFQISPDEIASQPDELTDAALASVAGGMGGEGMGAVGYVNPPSNRGPSLYTRTGINPDALPTPTPTPRRIH